MPFLSTLTAARTGIAAFAAMGVLWGTFAALLPDIKTMLGVDETRLGLLMFMTPIAAVTAMLCAPRIGAALGGVALPVSVALMALAFTLPGHATAIWMFPLFMMACGAATGLTDVLMNARVAALENDRGLHLMNLTHAAYSFGYAGGAIATGVMRTAGWSPAWVMGTAGLIALGFALLAAERDGQITGLVVPREQATGLGWVPVIGGAMVLIAFMTENAGSS
ncbi:MAG: hypothetical protein MUD11_08850 [Rhodobacteraceae bacterium]|nr:hypothetical protein [Paracoccaceae bacterium]